MPRMIVTLADSAFNGALQIDPAKRMLTGHPRDHSIVKSPAGATSGHEADVSRQCFLDKARITTGGADPFQSLAREACVGVVFRRTLGNIFQGRIERRHRKASICNDRAKV